MKKRKFRKTSKKSRRTDRMFIFYLVLLVVVIVIVNNVFFVEESANNRPKLGYNGLCNTASGGIKVDGLCYNCGVEDTICPEDFGTKCKIKDPDCS